MFKILCLSAKISWSETKMKYFKEKFLVYWIILHFIDCSIPDNSKKTQQKKFLACQVYIGLATKPLHEQCCLITNWLKNCGMFIDNLHNCTIIQLTGYPFHPSLNFYFSFFRPGIFYALWSMAFCHSVTGFLTMLLQMVYQSTPHKWKCYWINL